MTMAKLWACWLEFVSGAAQHPGKTVIKEEKINDGIFLISKEDIQFNYMLTQHLQFHSNQLW
jgi:hypothetical protein